MRVRLIALLAIFILSCGPAETERLKRRAEEWFVLLFAIQQSSSDDRDRLLAKLSSFIEPSAANKQRAIEYYERWYDRSSRLISASVDDVKIDQSGKFATVRTSGVWESSDGKRITASQESGWARIGGKWFRIIKPAKISVEEHVVVY